MLECPLRPSLRLEALPLPSKTLVKKVLKVVSSQHAHDSTGHDLAHILRVRALAHQIARQTPGSHLLIVELTALLHDIGDWKLGMGETASWRLPGDWLKRLGAEPWLIAKVCRACGEISFKGAGVKDAPSSLEAAIVQDADRLDAMGAIGVGRAFAFGGAKGRPMHLPGVQAQIHKSFMAYQSKQGSTIHHFYEKLLLLKDRLHTPTARRIALKRHQFLKKFLFQFLHEWDTHV